MRYIRKLIKPGYALESKRAVWGTGPAGDVALAFIGEAPGADEDATGDPFVGRAGEKLDKGLAMCGIYRPKCWVTNVLTRRPPENKFNSKEAIEALQHEMNGFWEELEWLVAEKHLRVVVALGANAFNTLGIEGSVTDVRGSVFALSLKTRSIVEDPSEEYDLLVIPTYHPAAFLHARFVNTSKTDDDAIGQGTVDRELVWHADLTKAERIAREGWTRPKERFNIYPTLQDVRAFRDLALKRDRLIAIDIETTALEGGTTVCIGFGWSKEDAICIPLLKQGGGKYWPDDEVVEVRKLVGEVLQGARLVLQYGLFDIPFLYHDSYPATMRSVEHDTLLIHHVISPELPHNIGFITSVYGDTPFWKNVLKKDVSILTLPDKRVRTYNCRDCVVLLQDLPGLLEDLRESGSESVYYEEELPLLPATMEMMLTGVLVDKEENERWRTRLEKEMKTATKFLYESANLPPEFKLTNDSDLRLFLYGLPDSKYGAAAARQAKRLSAKVVRDDTQAFADDSAVVRVWENTTPLWQPIGFKGKRTDGQKLMKTDKGNRMRLRAFAQKRYDQLCLYRRPTEEHEAEKAQLDKLFKWLTAYDIWARNEKLISTYTRLKTDEKGRIYTHLSPIGTATGRYSSKDIDLQNWPKREKDARKSFIAPPGRLFISADYINLEVGTMAYETMEPNLIRIFEEGLNQHDINTRDLFQIDKDDKKWDTMRRAAKTVQFGLFNYGGTERGIYEKVITEVPDIRLSFADFQRATRRYFEANPTYALWRQLVEDNINKPGIRQEDIPEQYRGRIRYRKYTSAFKRTRTFYGDKNGIVRQALNFPAQSAAAHVINMATIRLHDIMREREMRSVFQIQIHDQLIFEAWENEVEELINLVNEVMAAQVDFRGRIVKFPVDVEVGGSWGDLKAFERDAA